MSRSYCKNWSYPTRKSNKQLKKMNNKKVRVFLKKTSFEDTPQIINGKYLLRYGLRYEEFGGTYHVKCSDESTKEFLINYYHWWGEWTSYFLNNILFTSDFKDYILDSQNNMTKRKVFDRLKHCMEK